jgi:hypothetical protein
MFILYAIVIGLAVGVLAGGRIAAVGEIRFRWGPLMLLGFVAQLALFTDAVASRVGELGPALYVASTLVVVVAVLRSVSVPGMPVVAVGAASNLAAIAANRGFMPASADAMAALGKAAPTIYSNSAVLDHPSLAPLTDVFALPVWLPFHNIFSIGDVILGAGVAMVIVIAMRRETNAARMAGPSPEPMAPGGA